MENGIEKKNASKARVIQFILLAVSIVIAVIAAVKENATPAERDMALKTNGFWAVMVMLPALSVTGLTLCWFFAGFFKNRRVFSWCCCIAVTAFLLIAGFILFKHFHLIFLLKPAVFKYVFKARAGYIIGTAIALIVIVIGSKVFSGKVYDLTVKKEN